MNLAYLASPYTHDDPAVMEFRYQCVCDMTARLMRKGWHIYSPIAHCHGPAQHGLPKDFEYWQHYCKLMLDKCDIMIVYAINGWAQSRGVREEMRLWADTGKPMIMLNHASETPEPI